MENAIVIKQTATAFANKELAKATRLIVDAQERVGKNLMKIACIMSRVESEQLFADDFTSVAEYGEKVFGYKKSQTNNMVNVGKKFLEENGVDSVLKLDDGTDFGFTQLVTMLPLPSVEVAHQLVLDGEITPDMTVREIQQVVKECNNPTDETESEPETETETEPESDDTDAEIEIDSAAVMFLTAKDALDGLCEIFKDRTDICDRVMNIKRYLEAVENDVNEN